MSQPTLPFTDPPPPVPDERLDVPTHKHQSNLSSGDPVLCHVILDDTSADDHVVPALSNQQNASRLQNARYVFIEDGATTYFGQIVRGPIYTPEWGGVRDGTNIYPIVSGDKVEYVPSYHGYVEIQVLGEIYRLL